MAEKKFSISEAFKFGWSTWKSNIGFFLGLTVIWLAISSVPSIVDLLVKNQQSTLTLALVPIFRLLYWPIELIVGMGLLKISLKFVDGEKAEFADLYNSFRLFWRFLGASILFTLIAFAGVLLLIIPGIILGIKYGYAPYAVIDKELGPVGAIQRSGTITKGAKWQIFLFGLVTLLVALAGFVALFVGLLAAIPIIDLAGAYVYRKLDSQVDFAVSTAVSPEPV